jgi:sulfate adenylyltransferase subunit 1
VHLAFEEQALFDAFEQNRATGAFILIDPDTNNTVAGGMITAKRNTVSAIHGDDARVILSLPADLADQLMSGEAFAARRDEVEIRRVTTAEARNVIDGVKG